MAWWQLSLVSALRSSRQIHARERILHPTHLPSSSFHLRAFYIPVNCLYYSGFRCDKRLVHWQIMSYFIFMKTMTVTITTMNNYNANGSLQARQEGQSQVANVGEVCGVGMQGYSMQADPAVVQGTWWQKAQLGKCQRSVILLVRSLCYCP